jgi:ribulose-5-phosphate 4-epimerase/fuculose-1-phosphate aldolase
MMNKGRINELVKISEAAGNAPDKVQGGGGNTSVKLDDRYMAVKASGFLLKQITEKSGYVVVDYARIRDYYENIDLNTQNDLEKESLEFINGTIADIDGLKKLRPSVEAGFHSILKDYVIHTHSVYANILCCSIEGKSEAQKILSDCDYTWVWIPYINPGFKLSISIKQSIEEGYRLSGNMPEVIFLENHGLVIHADSSERCVRLHNDVNERIKKYYSLSPYPEIQVEEYADGYVGKTKFLKDFSAQNHLDKSYFYENALYPDQLVYLNAGLEGDKPKIKFNFNSGNVYYNTKLNEAVAIEETIVAYFYVISCIRKLNFTLKTMTDADIAFIMNWDIEKYRRKVIGNG